LGLYAAQAGAYSPGIFIAALLLALRPNSTLLAWTALPLLGGLSLLALFRTVEIYWIWGAFASLCAMLGIAYARMPRRSRAAWSFAAAAPALLLAALLFTITLAPAASYQVVHRFSGLTLHDGGPFEIFAFAPLAQDVRRMARARGALVVTDGYGLSSVLDFAGGVEPVVIGYDWQGREARGWYASETLGRWRRALFVDKVPFQTRPDFQRQFARACERVSDGGVRGYAYGRTPPRNFYFTWCEGLKPGGMAVLRWEREP
jgi:hypothetical protein